MDLVNGLIFFVVGALLGFLIARLTNKNAAQHKELKKELDKSQYELEQYRQELVDHFSHSAELMDNIAKNYSKLYKHMAKTSEDLMPNLPAQDNPFIDRIPPIPESQQKSVDVTPEEQKKTDEAPRDYAAGATGLLKDEPAEVIDINSVAKINTEKEQQEAETVQAPSDEIKNNIPKEAKSS
ncbi:DUF1043 family protein [Vibrio sp. SS-MA-C1-2]|uniref:Z-ring associated protein ZapG n=1 Tax=Vibrio sp. SS-MA-C1-2 TaxID=2908646 RepID=UPI001F3AC454|nr:DUF1043 family protein [Vibrio sp. SS-MA-C1-2]